MEAEVGKLLLASTARGGTVNLFVQLSVDAIGAGPVSSRRAPARVKCTFRLRELFGVVQIVEDTVLPASAVQQGNVALVEEI